MASGIKLTSLEMRYIALFQSVTGATVKDCIVDSDLNRIIFVVKEGSIGMAIGKRGKNIHYLEKITGKNMKLLSIQTTPPNSSRTLSNPPK